MKKKILYITVRADIGGGPKHLYQLIVGLIENDVEAFIASPSDAPFGEKYKEIAKDFLEIPHRKITFASLFKVILFCKKNKIDIVHSHGRGAGFFSRFLKLFGYKVIHTFHGVHAGECLKNRVALFIERYLKNFTDIFICVSSDEFKKAKKYKVIDANKTKIISNGVQLKPNPKERLNNSAFVLGALTRLDLMKGNDILIDYFSKLDSSYKLVIAGDGEERVALEKKARELNLKDRVSFLGNISDIDSFFNEIDILVSCSKGEGLPLSILEAQSFGVPTLLSNVKGHSEIGKDNQSKLFELNSFSDFKTKLSELNQEETFLKVRDRARELIQKKYSIDEMIEKYTKLYLI